MGILEWIIAVSVLSLVAWVVAREGDYLWARAGLIVLLITASMYVFALMDRHKGTPRSSELPGDVIVHGFKLDEDSMVAHILLSRTGEAGPPEYQEISVDPKDGLPQLPAALRKGRAAQKGKPFRLKSDGEESKDGKGDGKGKGDADQKGNDNTGGQSNKSERKIIVGLPPALMPEKLQ